MSDVAEAELQDLRERWEAIVAAMEVAWDTIAEMLGPAFEAIKLIVLYFAEMIQRAYLCQLLPRWIPEGIRSWLARHWPSRLLPQLAAAVEWMKTEAML